MYEKVYLERAFKTAESVQIKDKDRLRNLLYIKGDWGDMMTKCNIASWIWSWDRSDISRKTEKTKQNMEFS